MLETIIEWDKWLFGLLNGTWHHRFLDFVLPYCREKTTWIPLYLYLVFIVFKENGIKALGFLILVGITLFFSDQISSEWVKKSVERLRPCNDETLIGVRLLLENCGSGFSFTSSHACNHFALAMQLFLLFRKTWQTKYYVLLFCWAGLIGYAQIYVGVHYPIDILGGAILGCLIAGICYGASLWIFRIIAFGFAMSYYKKK